MQVAIQLDGLMQIATELEGRLEDLRNALAMVEACELSFADVARAGVTGKPLEWLRGMLVEKKVFF